MPTLNLEARLGEELIVNGGFTGSATGWTLGTGWNYGTNDVVHTPGNTAVLEPTVGLALDAGKQYRLELEINGVTAGELTATVGGWTYVEGVATGVYSVIVTNSDNLVFTPSSDFDGTVTSVSLKELFTEFAVVNAEMEGLFVNSMGLVSIGQPPTTDRFLEVHGDAMVLGVLEAGVGIEAGGDINTEGTIHADSGLVLQGVAPVLTLTPIAFASLPSPDQGMLAVVNDSTQSAKGSVIAGGGGNLVLGIYDGSDWIVV